VTNQITDALYGGGWSHKYCWRNHQVSFSIESWVIMRQGREFMFTFEKETKLYRELHGLL